MPAIPIARFEREVIENYLGRGKSPNTTKQFRQILRELSAVGVAKTSHVTDTAICRWIAAWPERSPETFKSHLRALSSLCTRMKKKGYLRIDPFDVDGISEWIRADARPSKPRRRWSKPADEIKRVLALATAEAQAGGWVAGRLEAYFHTLFLTGARPGEIQRLRIVDFHRRQRTIEIVAHWITGKSGRRSWWKPKTIGSAAELPIGDHLVDLLADWTQRVKFGSRRGRLKIRDCEWLFPGKMLWGPWINGTTGESPLDQVAALGLRAGVSGLTNKAARKGLGTYAEIGMTPQGRRKYFRHSDDATGDLYDENDIESRRGDAIRIEQFFTGT
jgi:integrase